MRVLAFGSYDARSHPRIGVLIGGLRERGADVTELNVPLGLDTAARVAILRQPWRLPLLGWQLLRCWTRLGWQGLRLRRRGAHPDAVLVGYLGHFDVHLARLLFPRSRIVLDQLVFAADTARDRGERGRGKARLLTALDTAAVRAADIVVVDTAEHRALLAPGDRAKAVVVPVGAPREWFGLRAGADRGESPLRMVFFGLFTPLQGTPVVGAALGLVADERGIEALMIGHGQDLVTARAAAAANPRVSWRHWVPPEELPGLVASHDVCLGIFGTGPKALRVVPNKVYQGAAAGCAIVTSDTPPQRRALGDAALFVPPGDPGALADALRELAADRVRTSALRAAAGSLADARFTPAASVAPLWAALGAATDNPASRRSPS